MPGVVIHIHLHQHVAGEKFTLAGALLSALHFHDFFRRQQNFAKLVFHAGVLDVLLERTHHLLLEAGIGVHDIPSHRHGIRSSAPLALASSSASPNRSPTKTALSGPPWRTQPASPASSLCCSATRPCATHRARTC